MKCAAHRHVDRFYGRPRSSRRFMGARLRPLRKRLTPWARFVRSERIDARIVRRLDAGPADPSVDRLWDRLWRGVRP